MEVFPSKLCNPVPALALKIPGIRSLARGQQVTTKHSKCSVLTKIDKLIHWLRDSNTPFDMLWQCNKFWRNLKFLFSFKCLQSWRDGKAMQTWEIDPDLRTILLYSNCKHIELMQGCVKKWEHMAFYQTSLGPMSYCRCQWRYMPSIKHVFGGPFGVLNGFWRRKHWTRKVSLDWNIYISSSSVVF